MMGRGLDHPEDIDPEDVDPDGLSSDGIGADGVGKDGIDPDGVGTDDGGRQEVELGWLVRDAEVLASLEIPTTRKGRALGLLGRDKLEGAMLLRPARSVHSVGMRFDLDVAFLDADNVVIRTLRLHRHRVTPPVWRARAVLEAEAGSFGRWELKIGDVVEIRV